MKKATSIIIRILYTALLLLSGLFLPWWVTLAFGVVGIVIFSWYFEALFLGLLFDVLYGFPAGEKIPFYAYLYSLVFLFSFLVFEYLKRKIQIF